MFAIHTGTLIIEPKFGCGISHGESTIIASLATISPSHMQTWILRNSIGYHETG